MHREPPEDWNGWGPEPAEPHYPPKPMRVQAFLYACGEYAAEQDARLAGAQEQRHAGQQFESLPS